MRQPIYNYPLSRFGVLHDGEVYDTEVNRDICPFEEGHVMSYGNKNKNKFFFSTCSQKVMNEFFRYRV